MRSEKLKMLAGEPYDASDAQLTAERARARALCQQLNRLPPGANEEAARLLAALFGKPVRASITPPFHCDYGTNIALGDGVYFNCNCVILDVTRVSIGASTLLGPGVHVYAATHPMAFEERRAGLESGKPVSIGDDVWVGGGAIVCPGVTIGAGTVIGAGSVVTRDVPARVFAAGNPCRVVRRL